jgi:ADP-ribose pyrophosphatase YjhB (NUDIX family)
MADRRRGESKELKKDQTIRREVREEIGSEAGQGRTSTTYRNPNRDQARGDWDRTGRHTDEERSRDTALDGDDGLGPGSRR